MWGFFVDNTITIQKIQFKNAVRRKNILRNSLLRFLCSIIN